ncbi:MAG: hypothetical protein FJ110_14900 [Deltaproteobacteria bacterium]|nr:hypothetical protein [Deltaproteobacteria bacterium]
MIDFSRLPWKHLTDQKIFFGHQSVGFNIIEGIRDLLGKNVEIFPKILETVNPAAFDTPVFAHSKVGDNGDARSKLKSFGDLLRGGIGGRAEVAFFKFCYVDITVETDIEAFFSVYKRVMDRLQESFPETALFHVTVPLKTVDNGIKIKVKRTLGLQVKSRDDNMKRNQFNDWLRAEYGKNQLLFDLAMVESTCPDGSRAIFEDGGRSFYHLAPVYTHDGGHLNERGRKWVAENLLLFLANRFQ